MHVLGLVEVVEVGEVEDHAEGVAPLGSHLDGGWVGGFGEGAGAVEDDLIVWISEMKPR